MAFWSRRTDPGEFLAPQPAPTPPPEPPKYVDESRFNQALDEVKGLNGKLDQFTGMFTSMFGTGPAQAQAQPGPQAPPPIPDITDAEYEEAVLRGDAQKIQVRTQAMVERAKRDMSQQWEGRFSQLEQQGMTILDQVSGEVSQQSLNTMPYYQLLKTDIDAALNQLPTHQRTPAMRTHIYNAVVGQNLDKVDAHRATENARIAQERNSPNAPGRTQTREQGPTPENTFGTEILSPTATWKGGSSLWGKRSPDDWAKSRYGVNNMQEAAVYANNVMNLSDCPTCFGPIINGKCHCRRSA